MCGCVAHSIVTVKVAFVERERVTNKMQGRAKKNWTIFRFVASLPHDQMKQLTITANATEETIIQARKLAIDERKSLREWAGDVILKTLARKRTKGKRQ
jgi:hypothetical protein